MHSSQLAQKKLRKKLYHKKKTQQIFDAMAVREQEEDSYKTAIKDAKEKAEKDTDKAAKKALKNKRKKERQAQNIEKRCIREVEEKLQAEKLQLEIAEMKRRADEEDARKIEMLLAMQKEEKSRQDEARKLEIERKEAERRQRLADFEQKQTIALAQYQDDFNVVRLIDAIQNGRIDRVYRAIEEVKSSKNPEIINQSDKIATPLGHLLKRAKKDGFKDWTTVIEYFCKELNPDPSIIYGGHEVTIFHELFWDYLTNERLYVSKNYLPKLVEMLLQHPHSKKACETADIFGLSPIHLVIPTYDESECQFVKKPQHITQEFLIHSLNTTLAILAMLIKHKININIPAAQPRTPLAFHFENTGRTPLHFAAATRHVECVEMLLAAGANVIALDANGKLPVECAFESQYKTLIPRKPIEDYRDERRKLSNELEKSASRKQFTTSDTITRLATRLTPDSKQLLQLNMTMTDFSFLASNFGNCAYMQNIFDRGGVDVFATDKIRGTLLHVVIRMMNISNGEINSLFAKICQMCLGDKDKAKRLAEVQDAQGFTILNLAFKFIGLEEYFNLVKDFYVVTGASVDVTDLTNKTLLQNTVNSQRSDTHSRVKLLLELKASVAVTIPTNPVIGFTASTEADVSHLDVVELAKLYLNTEASSKDKEIMQSLLKRKKEEYVPVIFSIFAHHRIDIHKHNEPGNLIIQYYENFERQFAFS